MSGSALRPSRLLIALLRPLGRRLVQSKLLRYAYLVPSFRIGGGPYAPIRGAWAMDRIPPLPEKLRSFAGIRRDPAAEQAAFDEVPLKDFERLHNEAYTSVMKQIGARRAEERLSEWWATLQDAGRTQRASRGVHRTATVIPKRPARAHDPVELTRELKAKAAEIGLSAIGTAPFDRKYIFAEAQSWWFGPFVIACAQEKNYGHMQSAPSADANKTTGPSETLLLENMVKLCEFLHSKGYRARANHAHGSHLIQHFAVEGGLGQMGLNGQLLTPFAGSRVRMSTIDTDAPLVVDGPRDYGVPVICDNCKVCVMRCPPGAIPTRRGWYRGVERIQIKEERCWPTIGRAHSCMACVRVCPVQKYGLQPVIDEFVALGSIKGKGTDELEGYDWIDGKHYGPAERPKLEPVFFQPPGWFYDPERTKAPVRKDGGLPTGELMPSTMDG